MHLDVALRSGELNAAILPAAVMLSLAVLCAALFRRLRKPYFGWFAAAWALHALRYAAIITFLATGALVWLYWHQVLTGWTALALLWAALVFSRGRRWRPAYLLILLFPLVWSYVAIFRMDSFLLAAVPAVAFLSAVTFVSGWVFLRYWRQVRAFGAVLLAGAMLLWGVHYLDYPFLRARGSWAPWGYYLDALFAAAAGAGILLLLHDDLRRGLGALLTLSGDLQRGALSEDLLGRLLERPMALPGVVGSALMARDADGAVVVRRGAGACARWTGVRPAGEAAQLVERAIAHGTPQFAGDWLDPLAHDGPYAFGAVLPVLGGREDTALLIVGDARDPFAALDEDYLAALGRQIGAALENADLYRRLEQRTAELEHLAARMLRQHEEERRRLSLHLHDETAQVFTAARLRLGRLRERAAPELDAGIADLLGLIDEGIRSIRSITDTLRPALLDELGLVPALRALTRDSAERTGVEVTFEAPEAAPGIGPEAELALFRAVQEALANVARHAQARHATVRLTASLDGVTLLVADDGHGFPTVFDPDRLQRDGHHGLAGMRERMASVGGRVEFSRSSEGGAAVLARVPAAAVSA